MGVRARANLAGLGEAEGPISYFDAENSQGPVTFTPRASAEEPHRDHSANWKIFAAVLVAVVAIVALGRKRS